MNAVTRPPAPNPIVAFRDTHAFLSNFYRSNVTYNGVAYPTIEHAFQAAKTTDPQSRAAIAALPGPRDAKAAGQQVQLRPDWEQVKKQVMLRLVMTKFARNHGLADRLAATSDAPLIEGNMWHDQFWGNCYCQRPQCQDPGLNYLGRILETARFILRADT